MKMDTLKPALWNTNCPISPSWKLWSWRASSTLKSLSRTQDNTALIGHWTVTHINPAPAPLNLTSASFPDMTNLSRCLALHHSILTYKWVRPGPPSGMSADRGRGWTCHNCFLWFFFFMYSSFCSLSHCFSSGVYGAQGYKYYLFFTHLWILKF